MSYRKITINDKEWEFVMGKEGVKLRDPQKKCKWVHKSELLNITMSEFNDANHDEKDQWKVERKDIQKYLERTLQTSGLKVKYNANHNRN